MDVLIKIVKFAEGLFKGAGRGAEKLAFTMQSFKAARGGTQLTEAELQNAISVSVRINNASGWDDE